jgi:hypothetical protein
MSRYQQKKRKNMKQLTFIQYDPNHESTKKKSSKKQKVKEIDIVKVGKRRRKVNFLNKSEKVSLLKEHVKKFCLEKKLLEHFVKYELDLFISTASSVLYNNLESGKGREGGSTLVVGCCSFVILDQYFKRQDGCIKKMKKEKIKFINGSKTIDKCFYSFKKPFPELDKSLWYMKKYKDNKTYSKYTSITFISSSLDNRISVKWKMKTMTLAFGVIPIVTT